MTFFLGLMINEAITFIDDMYKSIDEDIAARNKDEITPIGE